MENCTELSDVIDSRVRSTYFDFDSVSREDPFEQKQQCTSRHHVYQVVGYPVSLEVVEKYVLKYSSGMYSNGGYDPTDEDYQMVLEGEGWDVVNLHLDKKGDNE